MSEENYDNVRRAINFDLSTNALEEIFGKGNTKKPYSDIKHFMEKNGFEHSQYSGYVSKKKWMLQKLMKICIVLKILLPSKTIST